MSSTYKNSSKKEVIKSLKELDNFVISGHVNPDPDSFSSCASLFYLLNSIGKNCICVYDSHDRNRPVFKLIDDDCFVDYEKFSAKKFFKTKEYNFITVDLGSEKRVYEQISKIKKNAYKRISIDHHEYDGLECDVLLSDTTAASCSLLIWELGCMCGLNNDAKFAKLCFIGIISDTGSFSHKNTDSRVLRASADIMDLGVQTNIIYNTIFSSYSLASLKLTKCAINNLYIDSLKHFAITYLTPQNFIDSKATKKDGSAVIDILRTLDGVDVVCVLRQSGENEDVRGSLRCESDRDVSYIAHMYGGGGHKAAAGFIDTNSQDIIDTFEDVKNKLSNYL